ncbi:hypothetical protein [Acinetobacter sp. ANC 4910]|uniref:hypothetical protein n=1 Tax=Acinetobacter sp. ANC 4910 TaxID=2529850 RepID=UPI00148EE03D
MLLFKPCFALLCSILLFGCQQPESQVAQEQPPKQQQQEIAVDLTEMCKNLKKSMLEINNQRTTFALEEINQDLKVCLPLLKLREQKELMELSGTMYDNFLQVDRTPQQQLAFEQYAFDMAQHPTIQQSHFEQFSLRDQYLIKHQGQAYIELMDQGEGLLSYRRSPQYLAIVFAPYMPEAEKAFMTELAQQNTQVPFLDGALTIDPQEIVIRALFWENYLQQYPRSSYRHDAEYLLQMYTHFLFKGMNNAPVSESYNDQNAINSSSLFEIEKLAKLKHSHLAWQAQRFLQFLELSEQQRNAQIPVQLSPQQKQSGQSNLQTLKQLDQFLDLPELNTRSLRDCFRDAICLPPEK